MNKVVLCLTLVVMAFMLSGCAAGPNDLEGSANKDGVVAGFWRGLWNGLIAPVTFIISLFSSKVQMYEVHNSGNWYDFGFLLGVMITFGGSGGGARGAARRRWER